MEVGILGWNEVGLSPRSSRIPPPGETVAMFLTLEDPRARVKGFRDPLGVQALWTAFGRRVVFNLTTVTNSVRSFTVLLLGRWITERLVADGRISRDGAVDAFLRFEQIAGYARHLMCGDGGDVRGIERVRVRSMGRAPVRIGVRPDELILGDQKVYGLWGLFSVSARSTGWIEEGSVGLTVPARDFVDRAYAPRLSSVERELFALVEKGGELDLSEKSRVLVALGDVLPRALQPAEAPFYREWLRDAGHVVVPEAEARSQAALATALLQLAPEEGEVDGAIVHAVSARLRAQGRGDIADRLDRAAALEAFLAPAEAVFECSLSSGRSVPLADFEVQIRRYWPHGVDRPDREVFRSLGDEIRRKVGVEISAIMDRAFDRLAAQQWGEFARELAAWNAAIMKGREAGPWLDVTDDAIEVRYRGTAREIAVESGVARPWRNSYFLDALLAVSRQIEGAQ